MDVAILIQRLQQGEVAVKTTAEGELYQQFLPPTSLALHAARALQQLVQLHEGNQRVIQQLSKDNESLHEQIQSLQSINSSGETSGGV